MKKALKKIIRVAGVLSGMHDRIFGDISGDLYGDISGLSGNISSSLSGNISGLSGDISGLSGNIYECDISDDERDAGIDVSELIVD